MINSTKFSYDSAKSAVLDMLNSNYKGHFKALSDEELERYRKNNFQAGWQLPYRFRPGQDILKLNLLLPSEFPWKIPRIALDGPEKILKWSHVEENNLLCLSLNSRDFDPLNPQIYVNKLICKGCELLDAHINCRLQSDFQTEFESYWNRCTINGLKYYSLLNLNPPTRIVYFHSGARFLLVGEDEISIKEWVNNFTGLKPCWVDIYPTIFFWIKEAPIPPYPNSLPDLEKLLKNSGINLDANLLTIISEDLRDIPIFIGFNTKNGNSGAGFKLFYFDKIANCRIQRLPVPPNILLKQLKGRIEINRKSLTRVDASWIHGRDNNKKNSVLANKSVTIIGCGSVGSTLAIQLAQAGVGKIVLVDNDRLEWANISRHILGAKSVGKFKSEALANRLNVDFPHLHVLGYTNDFNAMMDKHIEIMNNSDLVISATAERLVETQLNDWQNQSKIPILYCWLEANIGAAHSLVIGGKFAGTLMNGFDNCGVSKLVLTKFPKEYRDINIPACGGTFQPYGSVELGMANSVISSLALDTLLNKVLNLHRIWVAPLKYIKTFKGEWTKEWENNENFQKDGGFIFDLDWN